MTAYQQTYQRPNLTPLVLLAVLATAAGLLLLSTHANKHSEADTIRRCLAEDGAIMELTARNDPSVKCFVVELKPCGRWAILIAQIWPSATSKCDMRERTAYMPKDGSPARVMDYLSKGFK
jgi:hypothetical protein